MTPKSALATRWCIALMAAASAGTSFALEFRSIGEATALYDAPSAKAKPLYAIPRGAPVEVVVNLEGWAKVRDVRGDLAWVERRLLAEQRTVIVRGGRAQVRATADDKGALVFEAEADVVLDLVEPAAGGWARVKHRDGQGGYVRAAQVWGL